MARSLTANLRLIAAALAVLATLALGWRAVESYREIAHTRAYDLFVDWAGARVIADGLDPYSDAGMKAAGVDRANGLAHPPTTFVWLLPFARASLPTAKTIWNALTLLWLCAIAAIAAFELRYPLPILTVALVVAAVCATSWMRYHFHLGQLSTLIALLYAIAWRELKRGRDLSAGIFLGLACTLKLYPGLVVVLLLLCRRFRVTASAGLAWLAFAVPITLRIGARSWLEFSEQTVPYTTYWMTHVKNASLHGVIQRLHFPICEFPPGHRDPWVPGTWIASAVALALAAGCLWVGGRAARAARTIDVPFAMFCLLSMIAGPYAWEHYDVTLIAPFLVALAALVCARRAGLPGAATAAGAGLLAAVVGMLALDLWAKDRAWELYHQKVRGVSHLVLHAREAANWLPAPLLLVLLGALLVWSRRHAPQALEDLRCTSRASARWSQPPD